MIRAATVGETFALETMVPPVAPPTERPKRSADASASERARTSTSPLTSIVVAVIKASTTGPTATVARLVPSEAKPADRA